MTRIENNYVKRESNQIGGKHESNQIRKKDESIPTKTESRFDSGKRIQVQLKTLGWIESGQPESNNIKNPGSNRVGNIEFFETADADDRDRGSG